MATVIKTPRVHLRTWQKEDFESFCQIFGDTKVTHFSSAPNRTLLRQMFEKETQHQDRHGCQGWAFWSEGQILGSMGLHLLDDRDAVRGPRYDLKAHLVPHMWNQGVSTEAGAHILRYGFERLGAYNIRACVHPNNKAAMRVLEKLRFSFEVEHMGERIFSRTRSSHLPSANETREVFITSSQPDERPQKGRSLFGFEQGDIDVPLESKQSFAPGTVLEVTSDSSKSVKVVRVLASPKSARARLYDVCKKYGIDPGFSKEVLDEVRGFIKAPGIFDPALEDLTHMPFVTIDNDDSRDLDQAVFIKRPLDNAKGFALFYALADAAYYAPPKSSIFKEALKRGSSYYLPGLSVPMLPPALSEGLTSLNPNVVRRALVFRIDTDEAGQVKRTRIFRGRIKSRMKLTYKGVQSFYDEPDASVLKGRPFDESLRLFKALGKKRMDLAKARNVVVYERHDVRVGYGDQEGMTFQVTGDSRNMCEKYNEQISLLCNMCGAEFFMRSEHPELHSVFRNHDAPPPQRLKDFRATLEKMSTARGDEHEKFLWKKGQPLADFLDGLPRETKKQARLTKAIHRQAMVLNVRSEFEPVPTGHHGIGAEAYARFSSPMREIVGIFTHKEAFDVLNAPAPDALRSPAFVEDANEDEKLRQRVIESANQSKQLQKRITKSADELAIDELFWQDAQREKGDRKKRTGTVMGFSQRKMYVQLDAPPIDIKVYISDLDGDIKVGENQTHATDSSGATLHLGDEVTLRLEGYETKRRRWSLSPLWKIEE